MDKESVNRLHFSIYTLYLIQNLSKPIYINPLKASNSKKITNTSTTLVQITNKSQYKIDTNKKNSSTDNISTYLLTYTNNYISVTVFTTFSPMAMSSWAVNWNVHRFDTPQHSPVTRFTKVKISITQTNQFIFYTYIFFNTRF